ncbi:MAG: nitroreductase family protein [Vampirovibrionia bacterium]
MIDQIISRRSIRKYTDEPVSKEDLNEILKAAMYAPSANNQQAWQFVILDDHSIMDQIIDVHKGAEPIRKAPAAIVICADKNGPNKDYLTIDATIATQNILLAAHSLGLGACWLAIYPREPRIEKLQELCQLPEHIMPFACVSLGHPAEKIETPDRFKKEKIHYNIWEN